MKLYNKKINNQMKVELLNKYIIFLENQYRKKYESLSNDIKSFMEAYLLKSNKQNIDNLIKYNNLYKEFKKLTNSYYILANKYNNKNLIKQKKSELKISNLNILRFM